MKHSFLLPAPCRGWGHSVGGWVVKFIMFRLFFPPYFQPTSSFPCSSVDGEQWLQGLYWKVIVGHSRAVAFSTCFILHPTPFHFVSWDHFLTLSSTENYYFIFINYKYVCLWYLYIFISLGSWGGREINICAQFVSIWTFLRNGILK